MLLGFLSACLQFSGCSLSIFFASLVKRSSYFLFINITIIDQIFYHHLIYLLNSKVEQFYNKLQTMLRLNDFLNPEQAQNGTALFRCLKNSIKRNIMFPSLELSKAQATSEYQSKLTIHNFQHKDLFLLFQHLYIKEEMSISDRNLIRKILLTIFPEPLIKAGGRKLIHFTQYKKFKKGEKSQGDKNFYLVMRGNVKIQSPFYQKNFTQGMYFGHQELLTRQPGNSFVFRAESQTSLICVNEQGFFECLAQFFHKQVELKIKAIPKIIIEKLEQIQILLLCDEMSRRTYPLGNKINKKNQILTEIIFVEQGTLHESYELSAYQKKLKTQNTVGLIQAILGSRVYLSDNFTLTETKVFYIGLKKFMSIAQKPFLAYFQDQNKLCSSSYIDSSFVSRRSKTEINQSSADKQKTEVKIQSIRKFLRIRKVNLPYSKVKTCISDYNRQSTQPTKRQNTKVKYQASFVFIDRINSETPNQKRYGKLIKSHFLIRDQRESINKSQNKRYLNNFQVPSLNQYKESN